MAVTTLTAGTCVKHMLQGIATHSVTDTTDDHKKLEMMMTPEHRTHEPYPSATKKLLPSAATATADGLQKCV